ncbi:MAG: efflux RND transporter periplasmic adaptor subunit [Bacteroidia bacterium]
MTKKQIITYSVIILVIALLAWPKIFNKKEESNNAAAKQQKTAPPVKVSYVIAQKQSVANTIQAIGNIIADEEVELHAEAQGRVVKINFTEGSFISKGKQILKIYDGDLQAQLTKALVNKKLKLDTEKRNKILLDKGAISQEAYEVSLTDLNATNADIELFKENIKHTEIIAPFSGKIGLKYISEGSFINSSTKIASMQKIDRVKIEFSIPERYISQVNVGTTVSFKVDGIQKSFNAKIYAIEPKVDPVNRNVLIRAFCENNNGVLLPGLFAKIEVPLNNKEGVFLIPTQSVVPILKGQKVFVIHGDSAIEQKVEVAGRNDLNVEVISGLKTGDTVVVSGIIQMKQGTKIKF